MLYELECPRSTSSPKSPIPTKTSFNNKTISSTEDSAHSITKSSTPSVIPLGNVPSPHLNGTSLQKNSVNNHNNFYSQNGSSSNRVTNGVKAQNSTAESSDSSDSEPETRENGTQIKTSPKSCTNSPKSNTNSPNSSLSSYSSNVNSPKNGFKEDADKCPPSTSLQSSVKKISNNDSNNATNDNKEDKKNNPQKINNGSGPKNVTKLVPYDVDDSSSSTDDQPINPHHTSQNTLPSTSLSNETLRSQIVTKAGAWRVSPTNNSFKGPSLEGQAGWNRRQRESVSELMHMSHEGYSVPVSTWNGTRAVLDREINNERREDRKRTMNDSNPDKIKAKQAKHNNNSYPGNKSSNPGYNPFQVSIFVISPDIKM